MRTHDRPSGTPQTPQTAHTAQTGGQTSLATSSGLRRRQFLSIAGLGGAAAAVLAAAHSEATDGFQTVSATTDSGGGVWDKTFPASDLVEHTKVRFSNRLGIPLVADLYVPRDLPAGPAPALVVGHPFGGVKEQTSGLYAQTMAERGFITIAHDASYNGESGGADLPHFIASPEAFVEDFSAAVDFLGLDPRVDRDRIGVIGVCGSGGFSLAAAQIDPRLKAVATVSMYDMGSDRREQLGRTWTEEQRRQNLDQAAAQRWAEAEGATTAYVLGTPTEVAADTPAAGREFYDYYRTPRGQHPRSTTEMSLTSNGALMQFYPFQNLPWISPRPVLLVAGENANSRYFSEEAYAMARDPRELHIVPGATHVDLYDRVDLIPWDRLQTFFASNL